MRRAIALACLVVACAPGEEAPFSARRDAFSGPVLGRGAPGDGLGALGLDRCGTSSRFVANTETGRVWGSRFGVSPFDAPDGGGAYVACLGPTGLERIISGGPTGLFSYDGVGWSVVSSFPNHGLASSPMGDRLIALADGKVELRDLDAVFISSFAGMNASYTAAAWSPAGTHAAALDVANSRVLLFDMNSMATPRSTALPPGVPRGPTLALGNLHPAAGLEAALSDGAGTIFIVNLTTGSTVNTLTLGGKFGTSMVSAQFNGPIDSLWVGDPLNNVVRQIVGTSAYSTEQSLDDEAFGSTVEFGAAGAARADGGAGVVYRVGASVPTTEGSVEKLCTIGVACTVCGDPAGTCYGGVLCAGFPSCAGGQVCTALGCVLPSLDAGSVDAGLDAGEDDAGLDAGADAGKTDLDAGVRDAGLKLDAGAEERDAGSALPVTFTASGCTGCSSGGAWPLFVLMGWVTRRRSGRPAAFAERGTATATRARHETRARDRSPSR